VNHIRVAGHTWCQQCVSHKWAPICVVTWLVFRYTKYVSLLSDNTLVIFLKILKNKHNITMYFIVYLLFDLINIL